MFKRLSLLLIYGALLTGSSLAQLFGNGPDGRPLGKLGKTVEVRLLYPVGKAVDSELLFPLVVECQNMTKEPQYIVFDWFSTDLTLPPELKTLKLEPEAKKRIPLILPGTIATQLSLQANRQEVQVASISSPTSNNVGILSNEGDKFDYLRSLKIQKNQYYSPDAAASGSPETEEYLVPSSINQLSSDLFPTHWGLLSSLGYLICYDTNALNLSDAQVLAIERWVRHGGQLILISNGIPNEFAGTKFEELLPLNPKTTETTGNRVVVRGEVHSDADIFPSNSDDHLLVSRALDYGRVWFCATPLTGSELLGEQKTLELWREIINASTLPAHNMYQRRMKVSNYGLLSSIPELPRTNAGWVAIFILMYGVVVGPINLTLLRKKDKMLYAFVTVPLIALFFAGSAYSVNRVLRPSKPVMREVGWLRLQSGSTVGPAESEQVLFNPSSRTFELSSNSATAFILSNYSYRRQARTSYPFTITPNDGLDTSVVMGTWDIQRFTSLSVLEIETAFEIKVDNKAKQVTIYSPLESTGESAIFQLPEVGSSEPFQLKKGENKLSFDQLDKNRGPSTSMAGYADEDYPGRNEMANRVFGVIDQAQNPYPPSTTKPVRSRARLLFWCDKVTTPISAGDDTTFKGDYFVSVEGNP